MIINEPSWAGREALSHPLHRQEEDWEPQGHPTVSITLPNDSYRYLGRVRARTCTRTPETTRRVKSWRSSVVYVSQTEAGSRSKKWRNQRVGEIITLSTSVKASVEAAR